MVIAFLTALLAFRSQWNLLHPILAKSINSLYIHLKNVSSYFLSLSIILQAVIIEVPP
jgi:hypothetical protein